MGARLVLDNTDKTGSLEQSVRWYRADPIPDKTFRIMRNRYYCADQFIQDAAAKLRKERDGLAKPELKTVAVAK